MWRMELQILMVLSFLCCMCFCIVVSLVSSVQFPSCVPVLLPSLFFLPTRTASPWLARPWSWCSFIYSLLCICSLNQTYLVKQFICPQCLLQVIFLSSSISSKTNILHYQTKVLCQMFVFSVWRHQQCYTFSELAYISEEKVYFFTLFHHQWKILAAAVHDLA